MLCMQWKNHRLTTCAVTYALTGSFPATAIATAASALPDVLELKLIKHRTLTHYPWLPLMPAALVWRSMQHEPGYILYVCFFILVGYVGHLAEDLLGNSGLPFWNPRGKRTGLHLYATRTPSEYVVALTIVMAALLYSWQNGMFGQAYLLQAADNTALFVTGMARHFSKV